MTNVRLSSPSRGERQGADRFGLVHFAVAEHAEDVPIAHRRDAAMLEIAHEARVMDCADRTDAHRARRELPEVGHQPRMRIRRQSVAADFLPIVRELRFGQAPLEKCARVDTGRRVRLKEDEIGAALVVAAVEEVVEADLEDLRCRRIARDVTAELAIGAIRADDHRERVPAHDGRDPLLEPEIAGIRALLFERNRVLVCGVRRDVREDAEVLRLRLELLQQEGAPLLAADAHAPVERVEPFARFVGIRVGVGRAHCTILSGCSTGPARRSWRPGGAQAIGR